MRHSFDTRVPYALSENGTRIFDSGFYVSAILALSLWSVMPDVEARDFYFFWKAAASLVQGTNPYLLTKSELVSLNSPIGLGLLWFFGIMSYPVAKQLYLILMYFAFFWSIWVGCKIFLPPLSGHSGLNLILIVVAIPFGMFFQVMAWGSLVIFALIGISAFYCIDAEKSPFLAGCCLGLCLIKPHLFVLVLVWIVWRSIGNRQPLLTAGLASVALIACLSALYLQPNIFRMYINLYDAGLPIRITNAALGNIIYSLPREKHAYLLFAPLLAGLCALPFLHRQPHFNDLRLSCVTLLPWSMLLSAYCWGHDYSVCFATTFFTASLLRDCLQKKRKRLSIVLLLEILVFFIVSNVLSAGFRYTWLFVFYGLSLAAISAVNIYADGQMRPRMRMFTS